MPKPKIAIVAHGRFHAFDLARALVERGNDVTLLTNYPTSAVERFGVPRRAVRSLVWHGVLDQGARRVRGPWAAALPESWMHQRFGRWAARVLAAERPDVVHCWSGVSEELMRGLSDTPTATLLMRGSAHIRTQVRLLREEASRAKVEIDCPSPWMMARECREYDLADRIVVLSSFARQSFVDEGVPADRVATLPLGVDVAAFRPSEAVAASRSARIARGDRLRVLYVGALSLRKGLADLVRSAAMLTDAAIDFTLVGPRLAEATASLAVAGGNVRVLAKQAQSDLPAIYAEADVFVFPTIEDGFGMVLTQAKAAGLPIVTTTNCAGPDLLTEGRDGWILPIRDPKALAERLRLIAGRRAELAAMADHVMHTHQPRDWSQVAEQFEGLATETWLAKAATLQTPARA